MFHHPSCSANTPLSHYRIQWPLFYSWLLSTSCKQWGKSLQELSGPPPLPEAQAGHHPPVLKETEHRKKVKIECFQIFYIMSCSSLKKKCTWEMPWSVASHQRAFFNWSVFSHCHRQTQNSKTMWEREEMHTTFFSEISIIPQSSNLIIVYFASFTFLFFQYILLFQWAFLHDQ